jgi:hypothetical protein
MKAALMKLSQLRQNYDLQDIKFQARYQVGNEFWRVFPILLPYHDPFIIRETGSKHFFNDFSQTVSIGSYVNPRSLIYVQKFISLKLTLRIINIRCVFLS